MFKRLIKWVMSLFVHTVDTAVAEPVVVAPPVVVQTPVVAAGVPAREAYSAAMLNRIARRRDREKAARKARRNNR